jgi:DNA-binding FadR family transcriptional regulator
MQNSKRLYQGVLVKMLDLIDSGEYPRELAERFNVSRPTIREAIIALETLKRVQVKTGSGVYVLENNTPIDHVYQSSSAFELTEARALIEGEIVALAAKMITPEQLAQLEQSLVDMARENDAGDLAAGDADRAFHHLIAESTQNKVLILMTEQLWQIRNNAPQVFEAYKSICEQDGAKRVEEHREIFEALAKRDAGAARAAMHEHFARILHKLIASAEEEKLKETHKQLDEVRKRFSFDPLTSNQ